MPTKKSDSDLVIPPSERMNSTVKNVNEGTERTLAYKIKKMEQNKEKFRKKSEQEQLMFAVQHMTVGNTQTQTAAERMLDEKRKMSLIAEEVDSRDVSSDDDDDDDSINDGPTWGGGGFFSNSKDEEEEEDEEEDDTTEKEGPHKVNSGDNIDQRKMLDDLAKQPRYSRLLPSRNQTSAEEDKHIINVFQKNTLDFKLLRDVAKTNEEIVSQIQYRRYSTDTPLAQKWKARAKKFEEEQEFNQRGAGKGRKTAFVAHLSKHKMSTANQLIMEPPQMAGGRRGRCSLPALPRKSGMFNHKELEEARTPVRLWLNALDDINAGKLERNEKQEKEREIELQKKVIDVWQRRRSISVDNPILSLNANRRRSVSVGDSPLTSRARPPSTKPNDKGSTEDVPPTTAPATRRMERRVSFVKFLPKSQQTEILKEAQKMK